MSAWRRLGGAHARRWDERWTALAAGPPGGQSRCAIVAATCGPAARAFLKVLAQQGDCELRKRFQREVAALETLRADGVPRLIESNAHHWEDAAYELYAVCELIEGATLVDAVASSPVAGEQALRWTDDLCRILTDCHRAGVVHRDIKPDNLLVAPATAGVRALRVIDFGMAVVRGDAGPFRADLSREVGNPFFRLPESYQPGADKLDLRSDVTLAAGILFYLLTVRAPAALEDQRGRLPHRRPGAGELLRRSGLDWQRLAQLFDRAFERRVERRCQSAAELRATGAGCGSGAARPACGQPPVVDPQRERPLPLSRRPARGTRRRRPRG